MMEKINSWAKSLIEGCKEKEALVRKANHENSSSLASCGKPTMTRLVGLPRR
jgi:hypothetical protein